MDDPKKQIWRFVQSNIYFELGYNLGLKLAGKKKLEQEVCYRMSNLEISLQFLSHKIEKKYGLRRAFARLTDLSQVQNSSS